MLFGVGHHLLELGVRVRLFAGEFKESLVVGLCWFAVGEIVVDGVGDVVIGGDRGGVICQMSLPRLYGFIVLSHPVVGLALRECDGLHGGGVGQHKFGGQIQIADSLFEPSGIDADHPEAVGAAGMLHAT